MLSINISELIWTIINFFLLYFLLRRFLFNPIVEFMDKRQARIDAGLEEERKAMEELQANRDRLEAEKEERRREAKQLLEDAGAENERRSAETLAAARSRAEDDFRAGMEELRTRREREEAALSADMRELSALLADRLLEQEN